MTYYVVVEGHGEPDAVLNLLHRLQKDMGLPAAVWGRALRKKIMTRAQAEDIAALVRGHGDVDGLLITRDDEDGCPRESGPTLARWLKELTLPFPVAVSLFFREYETLFLPCVEVMAGQPLRNGGITRSGLRADAAFAGDYETKRDAKGVLTELMSGSRSYKPTTDQLPFTRMLDFETLRKSQLPCFGTLERALAFLLQEPTRPGRVFPIDRPIGDSD